MVEKKEELMQEWLKKIVETEEKRKVITPHQPFYISKRDHCPICKKVFEIEVIEDFTLDEEYYTYSYEEWVQKLDITDKFCPLCGETFDFFYTCMVCSKTIRTNVEKKNNDGLSMILCDSEECRATFKRNHKRRRCPLCNHINILSLNEDYTMFQLFEENSSADYWKNEIERVDTHCPLCGSVYLAIKPGIICGNLFRTFHKQQLICKSPTCTKLRLEEIKRKRRLKRKQKIKEVKNG